MRVEEGTLGEGSALDLEVSEWTRRRTQANHTGTHLLHAALRKVLGDSVRQMGSLVAPDRLRFDYAATRATTHDEIAEILGTSTVAVRQRQRKALAALRRALQEDPA